MFRIRKKIIALLLTMFFIGSCGFSQNFITGADLSYTNTILENGGVYRNAEGEVVDP